MVAGVRREGAIVLATALKVAGDDPEVRRLDLHVGFGLHVAVVSRAGGSARN